MTTNEAATKLGINSKYLKKYKGQFKYWRSFFYRGQGTSHGLVDFIKAKIPTAEITNHGEHWHEFVGGAKSGSAQDSFWWVTFKI